MDRFHCDRFDDNEVQVANVKPRCSFCHRDAEWQCYRMLPCRLCPSCKRSVDAKWVTRIDEKKSEEKNDSSHGQSESNGFAINYGREP